MARNRRPTHPPRRALAPLRRRRQCGRLVVRQGGRLVVMQSGDHIGARNPSSSVRPPHMCTPVSLSGTARTAEALRTFGRAQLTPYKCPRDFVFSSSLPRTSSGKFQRGLLRGS
ncbi:AMP-binding enzyme [Streptomyces camelliae]|uniref:AMP-binding enzyme n=1 Tax=Streptomyces camelliae TaxID=3004093 RepID=UPI003D177B2E